MTSNEAGCHGDGRAVKTARRRIGIEQERTIDEATPEDQEGRYFTSYY